MSSFALPKPIVKICSNLPNQEIGNRTAGPSDTAAILVVDGGLRYGRKECRRSGPDLACGLHSSAGSGSALSTTGLAWASAPLLPRGWGLPLLVASSNAAAPCLAFYTRRPFIMAFPRAQAPTMTRGERGAAALFPGSHNFSAGRCLTTALFAAIAG
jgi:hypothetical protein